MLTKEQMKERMNEIIKEEEKIHEKASNENRDFTPSEQEKWDALEIEFEGLVSLRDRAKRERWGQEPIKPDPQDYGIEDRDIQLSQTGVSLRAYTPKNLRRDYYRFNVNGNTARDAFNRYLMWGERALTATEYRNLAMDLDASGGFLTAPVELAKEIIKDLDDEVVIRQLSRKFTMTHAMSLGVPELADDLGDPEWTAELKTGSEDDDMDFQRRDLYPHPVARRIRVSNKLLRAAVGGLSPENLVRERMAYKLGVVGENAYMTGDGVNKPLGIFIASNDGIDTSRDTTSTGSATVQADDFITAVGALKAGYRKNATWVFHRDLETRIMKLKTGDGAYIWQSGLSKGGPPSLCGLPYVLSEYAPHTFSSGQYIAIVGDFRFYWIVDALNVQIQVLKELYAETNQTGFICRVESDGAPVVANAFSRIKLG